VQPKILLSNIQVWLFCNTLPAEYNYSGTVCFCKVDTVVDELPELSDDGQQKPKKLTLLKSRYSDSDGEETREQCKARMVCMCIMVRLLSLLCVSEFIFFYGSD